jgi:hypothetical protein
MSSDSSDGNDLDGINDAEGRSRHLGAILLVFYHRGGTWHDFGMFLENLFSGALHKAPNRPHNPFTEQKCRHGPQGLHTDILETAAMSPDDYPMFNHGRYFRPCISFGKGEANKTPGFVVADTVVKARRYLESIGKGDIVQNSAYSEDDSDYDPDNDSDPGESAEDQLIEVGESLSETEQVGGPTSDDDSEMQGVDGSSQETSYGSIIALSDVEALIEQLDGPRRLRPRAIPETSQIPITSSQGEFGPEDVSFHASQHARVSTKMRAATLGYLRGFSRDPERLCEETHRLRTERNAFVLHLCGCGMPYTNNTGALVPGCCEWSHLRLGSSKENALHKMYHSVMGKAMVADYPRLCDIIHRAESGYDLF